MSDPKAEGTDPWGTMLPLWHTDLPQWVLSCILNPMRKGEKGQNILQASYLDNSPATNRFLIALLLSRVQGALQTLISVHSLSNPVRSVKTYRLLRQLGTSLTAQNVSCH